MLLASAADFVRVDAPVRSGECVVAARDVVVVDGDVLGALRPGPCPVLSVAPDGTAALAGVTRAGLMLSIRPAGGSFGAPVRLSRGGYSPAVAAASGGKVTVAWRAGRALRALTTAPLTRVELDRGEEIGDPVVSADGTVAWTAADRRRWVATLPGARAELPGGAGQRATDLGVWVADGVVAWAADDGIRVRVDGEGVRTVAPLIGGALVTGARGADGSVVVVFAGADNALFAVSRAAGGEWSAPHQLWDPAQGQPGDFSVGGRPFGVEVVVSGDGRAAVAWRAAVQADRGQLLAVAGQAGGAWGTPRALATPTRSPGSFSLSLDAAGEPRLLWTEPGGAFVGGPLRAARLGVAVPDATPPVVDADIPRRLPATRSGRVALAVPVRCSEACDARLSVDELDWVARGVGSGGATLRLRVSAGYAASLIRRVGPRRMRVTVEVSDVAGNLVRRSRVVSVRVLPVPLRSFRVGPGHDFAMFSAAGNRAVGRMVNALVDALADGASFRRLVERYDAGMRAIERAGHDEVRDTAVLDEIQRALDVPFARRGYSAETLLQSA